jgi:hypothetical protein
MGPSEIPLLEELENFSVFAVIVHLQIRSTKSMALTSVHP